MADVTRQAAQAALGDLVCDMHVEASRHPDMKASLIRQTAAALDDIRLRTIVGTMPTDDAFVWLDEGRKHLADLIMQRCLTEHPARRVIAERARDDRA